VHDEVSFLELGGRNSVYGNIPDYEISRNLGDGLGCLVIDRDIAILSLITKA
jgi:hypothetical protein